MRDATITTAEITDEVEARTTQVSVEELLTIEEGLNCAMAYIPVNNFDASVTIDSAEKVIRALKIRLELYKISGVTMHRT